MTERRSPWRRLLGGRGARRRRCDAAAPRSSSGATVWSLDRNLEIGISVGGVSAFVKARRVILATGALERPFPIPGWTLPGVMTAGAAQTMLKSSGARAGRADGDRGPGTAAVAAGGADPAPWRPHRPHPRHDRASKLSCRAASRLRLHDVALFRKGLRLDARGAARKCLS